MTVTGVCVGVDPGSPGLRGEWVGGWFQPLLIPPKATGIPAGRSMMVNAVLFHFQDVDVPSPLSASDTLVLLLSIKNFFLLRFSQCTI